MEVVFGGLVLLVPIALLGAVFAWAISAQKKRDQAWANVAERLGLAWARQQIWGVLDGQSVQLRVEVRGSGKHRSTWTVAASFLQPPIDLGLSVTKQGFLSNTFGTLFGAQDVAVGDAAFDPAYVVKADEPPRAQRLLDSELRRFLVGLAANDAGMRLGDAGGYMERRGAISDEASIEWLLQTVALAARRMHEARQSVPPAAALAPHRAAWMEYARAAGMTGMDTPLCIWGRMSEDAAVSAYAVRVGEGQHRLEVLVRFDAPLGLGLLVRPTKTLDGIASFFGGQDHALGDAAFDRAFVVKAPSADRLSRILDAEVRKGLVELAVHAIAVQVQDEGVTVRAASFPADPAEVPRLVAQVRGVARSIQVNATRHEGAGIGPYR